MVTPLALPARAQPQPAGATVPQDRVAADDQLLASHGVLTLRVKRQDEAADRIDQAVRGLGGRLQRSEERRIDVRVPAKSFVQAMTALAGLGVELDRRVEVRDLTPEYIDTLSRLRSAEQTLGRLRTLRAGAPGVEDPLRVERDLQRWESDVAQMQRALRDFRVMSEEATIEVLLEPTEAVLTEEVPPFQLPFAWLDDVSLENLLSLEPRSPPEPERSVSSSVQMDLHLKMVRAADDALLGENRGALLGGFTMRGVGETQPVGFAAGSDLEVGGGFSGGFAYDLRMLFGLGAGAGEWLAVGALTGLGIGGVTEDHVPFGVDVPIEVFAGIEVGDLFRTQLWGRSSFLLASDDRQEGSEHAPFGDELHTGLSLLLGEQEGDYNPDRMGFVLTGAYRELMGTQAYEMTLGYGAAFLELR